MRHVAPALIVAVIALGGCAFGQKIAEVQNEIEKLDAEIASLEGQLATATGEDKARLEGRIAALRDQRNEKLREKEKLESQAGAAEGGIDALFLLLGGLLGVPVLAAGGAAVAKKLVVQKDPKA